MVQENFDADYVGTSRFYMLRCLVAMAHADGIVTDEERAYFSALTMRLPLSDAQRATLDDDLDTAQDVADLLPHINEPQWRSQLIYFARLMAYKDGVLDPSEQDLLDKMHSYVMDRVDMAAIREDVAKVVHEKMALHDISVDEHRPMKGKHFLPWFQLLDQMLLSIGIDLMKD
ncbi:MAG: TerB family tellurite resistance protein [Alphaproteobacteria bacterium]|nr:TerB family tellurite resistance protein [Alphaproteobacteria bacterium]